MKFTKGGVVLDDDAVAALELAMDEMIAKKKVMRKMHDGCVGYCSMQHQHLNGM